MNKIISSSLCIVVAAIIMPLCGSLAALYFPNQTQFIIVLLLTTCTYFAGLMAYKGISELCDMQYNPSLISYEWAYENEVSPVYIMNTEGGIDVIDIDWDNDKLYNNGKPFHNEFNDLMDIRTLFLDYMVSDSLTGLTKVVDNAKYR